MKTPAGAPWRIGCWLAGVSGVVAVVVYWIRASPPVEMLYIDTPGEKPPPLPNSPLAGAIDLSLLGCFLVFLGGLLLILAARVSRRMLAAPAAGYALLLGSVFLAFVNAPPIYAVLALLSIPFVVVCLWLWSMETEDAADGAKSSA